MALDDLTPEERELVRKCLVAACDGPYFPDLEFEVLFGLTRAEVAHIAHDWPGSVESPAGRLAINNALLHLLSYPHKETQRLERDVAAREAEIGRIYAKWLGRRRGGIR